MKNPLEKIFTEKIIPPATTTYNFFETKFGLETSIKKELEAAAEKITMIKNYEEKINSSIKNSASQIKITEKNAQTTITKNKTEPKRTMLSQISGNVQTQISISQQNKNETSELKITEKTSEIASLKRLKITIEEQTDAIIEINLSKEPKISYLELEIEIKENSTLSLIISGGSENIKISDIKTTINENSEFKKAEITKGSEFAITFSETILKGERSKADIRSIIIGNRKETSLTKEKIIHKSGKTESSILQKAVMSDNSRSIIINDLDIKENTKDTKAKEKTDAIILGDNARIDAFPSLNVNSNLTETSHGVSISYIDKKKTNYLMSKGISEEKSKQMITEAFIKSALVSFGKGEEKIKSIIKTND